MIGRDVAYSLKPWQSRKGEPMKGQESLLKREMRTWKWSGLRAHMTISYVLVTLAAALVVEILLMGLLFILLTHFSLASSEVLPDAMHVADWSALSAAVQADGSVLNPHTTFTPGQPASIALPAGDVNTPAFN